MITLRDLFQYNKPQKYDDTYFIRYLCLFFSTFALESLLIISLFHFSDPLEVFQTRPSPIGHYIHPKQLAHERFIKSINLNQLNPAMIALGSSRTHIGINPGNLQWNEGLDAYNLGVGGGTLYESLMFLKHAQSQRPVKKALIEVDYINYILGTKTPAETQASWLEQSWIVNYLSYLFSKLPFQLLFESKIQKLDSGQLGLAKNGQVIVADESGYRNPKKVFQQWIDKNSVFILPALKKTKEAAPGIWLQEISAFCQDNGIQCDFYLPPYHASILDLFATYDPNQLNQWKAEITDLLRSTMNRTHKTGTIRLWDFSYKNRITEDPIPESGEATMQWYYDNNHFRPSVGDLILKTISSPTTDFGKRLL